MSDIQDHQRKRYNSAKKTMSFGLRQGPVLTPALSLTTYVPSKNTFLSLSQPLCPYKMVLITYFTGFKEYNEVICACTQKYMTALQSKSALKGRLTSLLVAPCAHPTSFCAPTPFCFTFIMLCLVCKLVAFMILCCGDSNTGLYSIL